MEVCIHRLWLRLRLMGFLWQFLNALLVTCGLHLKAAVCASIDDRSTQMLNSCICVYIVCTYMLNKITHKCYMYVQTNQYIQREIISTHKHTHTHFLTEIRVLRSVVYH